MVQYVIKKISFAEHYAMHYHVVLLEIGKGLSLKVPVESSQQIVLINFFFPPATTINP
jgi:hypothetical protein